MKRIYRYGIKLMISGILATAILSVFCLLFDNGPVVEPQPLFVTNYRYAPNAFWSDMREGFGIGITNDCGYNDSADWMDASVPAIVFLGSSHTEAFQMRQEQQYVSRIREKLWNDKDVQNDYQCLNLGISGHSMSITVSNFEYVAAYFENMKYAVIEVSDVEYLPTEFQRMLNEEYHKPLKKGGLASTLFEKVPVLRIPFLRTLKKQYDRIGRDANDSTLMNANLDVDYDAYEEALDPVLKKLSMMAENGAFEIVIVYHHSMEMDDQDGLVRKDDLESVQIFQQVCERYGIHFVDVVDDFIANYHATKKTSHGFANTAMNEGHLNAVGHKVIAEVLYSKICEIEKEK